MSTSFIKSGLRLTVLLPMLALAFSFSGAAHATTATTWYVNSSNTSVTPDGSAGNPFTTIQAAVTAANSGDTIQIQGTQTVTSAISLTKQLTIEGAAGAEIDTTGSGYVFSVNPGASGTVIENLKFVKTDTVTDDAMIFVNTNSVSIENNTFQGTFNIGDAETERGLDVANGITGLDVGGNTFTHVRQPGYINNATGTVHDNETDNSKGWVVVSESNITFTNNSWGTNVGDIAIIKDAGFTGVDNYSNINAISAANNNAVVEDQTLATPQLSVVYVNASAAAGGNGTEGAPYQHIQDAMARVVSGGTVNVAAGTYNEDVTISTPMTLKGAGAGQSIIMGLKTGSNVNTLTIGSSNVTVDGFTITRDGNNAVDWNTNVKTQGVFFSQGITGSTLENSTVSGNRNGVYINNAQGNTLTNDTITDNRTGIQFANNVTGTTITNSSITNNWTLGILFNFDAGLPTSNVAINHNTISGNWYGDVESRYTATTNSLNLQNNWFGVVPPTVSSANSTEPGYAAQIPTEFGGTAAAPTNGVSNLEGTSVNLIDYSPYCVNSSCTPDTTGPTVTVTPPAGSLIGSSTTFTITVSDNSPLDPSKLKHIWTYLYNTTTGQSKGANVDLSTGTGTFTVDTTALPEGIYNLDVGKLYDAAGNPSGASDTYFKHYVIDNTAPVVTITPVAGTLLGGTQTFTINVTDNNPLDATKNKKVWVYLYDNAGTQKHYGANVDLSSGTGTFTVDTSLLDDGAATLDVGQVYDAAGNASGSGDSYFKNFVIDNTAPVVTVTPTASTLSGSVTFNITVTDAHLNATTTKSIWVYLYDNAGTQKNKGAKVDLSNGTGTFTVDTTLLDNGAATLDVGKLQDAAGNFSGRSDTYFKGYTIDNGAPAPIGPSVPTNGTPNGTTLNTNNFDFNWDASTGGTGAISYEFQSTQDSTTTNGVLTNGLWNSGTLTTNSIHSSGAGDGTWYWQVRAIDANGNKSDWSPVWSVTLDTATNGGGDQNPTPSVTTNAASDVSESGATLNGTDGAVNADDTSFWWGPTTAGPFTPSADPGSEFPAGWNHDSGLGATTTGNSFTEVLPGLTADTTYTYVAWVEVGGIWYPGDTQTFTTSSAVVTPTGPTVPTLSAPDNAATVTDSDFSFGWNASTGTGDVTYELESSLSDATNTDGSFTTRLADQADLTATTVDSPSTPDNTYYWHVRATDSSGTSAWSDTWSVTVSTADSGGDQPSTPSAPTLVFPANGATLTSAALDHVSWSAVTDANMPITYTYEVSSASTTNPDGTFASPFDIGTSGTGLTTNERSTVGTGAGTYYWHVQAVDALGNKSAWSDTGNFTVTVDQEVNPPTATAQSISLSENGSAGITFTSESDSQPVTYATTTSPQHGTLSDIIGSSVTYTPDEGYFGSDSFSFTATANGQTSAPALVSITITQAENTNNAPVADDQDQDVTAGDTLDIALTASDEDEDALTYSTTTSPAHGTLSGISAEGAVTYTPDEGYTGPDSFDFVASDGQSTSSPATVHITVNAAESRPQITANSFSGGSSGGSGQFTGVSQPASTGETGDTGGRVLGASTFNFTRDLHIGMRGDDVTALQQFLIAAGFKIPAGATGYFGVQTRSALAAYQAANGIKPAVGYFGPITRAAVNQGTIGS